jgi:hypothetical protein
MYGTDFDGNTCGSPPISGTSVNLYYPQLQKDLAAAYANDRSKYDPSMGGDPTAIPLVGVCVDECPTGGSTVYSEVTKTTEFESSSDWSAATRVMKWTVPMNTTSVFYRCKFLRADT